MLTGLGTRYPTTPPSRVWPGPAVPTSLFGVSQVPSTLPCSTSDALIRINRINNRVEMIRGEFKAIDQLSIYDRMVEGSSGFRDRAWMGADEIARDAQWLWTVGCISNDELARWQNFREDIQDLLTDLGEAEEGIFSYIWSAIERVLEGVAERVLTKAVKPTYRRGEAQARDIQEDVEEHVDLLIWVGAGILGVLAYMAFVK